MKNHESASLLDQFLAEAELSIARGQSERPSRVPTPTPNTVEDESRYLLITLGGKLFALPASQVVEVSHPLKITRVPNVADWLLGVANVRGDILSVVDLRAFLGIGISDPSAQPRMVTVQSRANDMGTILVVDRVRSLRRLDLHGFQEPTMIGDARIAAFARAMGEHDGSLLIVVDLERMLLSPEFREVTV